MTPITSPTGGFLLVIGHFCRVPGNWDPVIRLHWFPLGVRSLPVPSPSEIPQLSHRWRWSLRGLDVLGPLHRHQVRGVGGAPGSMSRAPWLACTRQASGVKRSWSLKLDPKYGETLNHHKTPNEDLSLSQPEPPSTCASHPIRANRPPGQVRLVMLGMLPSLRKTSPRKKPGLGNK